MIQLTALFACAAFSRLSPFISIFNDSFCPTVDRSPPMQSANDCETLPEINGVLTNQYCVGLAATNISCYQNIST